MKIKALDDDLSTLIEHLGVRGFEVDTLLMDHIHKINFRLSREDKISIKHAPKDITTGSMTKGFTIGGMSTYE